MRKQIFIILALVITATLLFGFASATRVAGHNTLLVSAAGAETDLLAATGFNVGVPAPDGDLGPVNLYDIAPGRNVDGKSTGVNAVVLTCYATSNENDDVDIAIYGISQGGAPERITNLLFTFGTAIRSTGVRWADTCVSTATHLNTVLVSDSANNRIVKISFDTAGYEYLYAIAYQTTTGSATGITVKLRHF